MWRDRDRLLRHRHPGAYDWCDARLRDRGLRRHGAVGGARVSSCVRDAIAADVPVLGICFGSQSLARALGGPSDASAASRSRCDRDRLIASLRSCRRARWLQWHARHVHRDPRAPPCSRTVQRGPHGRPRLGRSLGVQLPSEVTPRSWRAGSHGGRGELEREGIDPERLAAEDPRIPDDDDRPGRVAAVRRVSFDRVAALGSSGSRTR